MAGDEPAPRRLGVGARHRGEIHTQALGEPALSRQLRAGTEPTARDVGGDPVGEREIPGALAPKLGHRMLDDMFDAQEHVRQRPAWQPVPAEEKAWFSGRVPTEGVGAERAYEDFRRHVLPYPSGNTHPRFWGWVLGTGTPLGMLADMLAAGFNPNCWGNETSAAYVEAQVLDWFKSLLGFPADASGLLVTGCSVANLIGLTVARNAKAGIDLAGRGLVGIDQAPVLYCSTETHSSVDKAALVLGLGAAAVRKLPTTSDYRLDVSALRTAIDEDTRAGRHPFAVVANAGTVNTGALDELDVIADVAREHDLWLHVDGAFGALAALVPEERARLAGLERADSVAFDLHKWLYVPFDAACVLVRDAEAHRRSFSPQARYLAALVTAASDLELCAPVSLNIVCFRVRPRRESLADINDINREVLFRLQERGIAVPSSTTLEGRYVIRVAITNHRSRREDFDLLVAAVTEIAREVRAERVPG